MGGTETNRDEVVDLVAAEAAEREDDTIVVTRTDEPGRRRPPTWMLVAGAAVVVLVIALAAFALTGGDDDGNDTVTASDTEPESSVTTDAPTTSLAVSPTTVASVAPSAPPAEVETPPATDAPAVAPVAPPTAPPAAGTPASFGTSVNPTHATVTAGTGIPVTLTVANSGGTAGDYTYDTDGCDPMLVPNPDISCTQATRQVNVAANSFATVTMNIDTTGATPGTYNVPVGDSVVVVTITA